MSLGSTNKADYCANIRSDSSNQNVQPSLQFEDGLFWASDTKALEFR